VTRAVRIVRIERRVRDPALAAAFYADALGFCRGEMREGGVALRRGAEMLVLRPGGAAEDCSACDQGFQHIALPVSDMAAAMARLQYFVPSMISVGGAQLLPASSGGVAAVKFRDPDGHPVEFLRFPDGREGGIDHSAMVVADVARSLAFYRDELGLRVTSRQVNSGIGQDRLDGLSGVEVEVVALSPPMATPHVEFLGYRHPVVRRRGASATRLVFEVEGGDRPEFLKDPDGHELVLLPNRKDVLI